MLYRLVLIFLITIPFSGSAAGDNLFKVEVRSQATAERLTVLGVEALCHVRGGYLVLADADASQRLAESGLYAEKIASNISKENLAIDMRRDDINARKYPLVYEDGGLRILRADLALLSRTGQQLDLAPFLTRKINIEYKEPRAFNWNSLSRGVDLDSLIGLVEKDSLISYTERLQAFLGRLTGTDSNYASADWIMSKFQEFGYDSVYLDTFTADIYGELIFCKNVVATKLGSVFPGKHIVVGGHRDAVSNSPGADDNASGTVATMEMARVMKNIDCDVSFVFVAFDAEEQGLHGSWNYAGDAAERGDTILFMLNSDMIGNYENTDQANSGYVVDSTYSLLWATLADSLLGVTGHLYSSLGGSDHVSFSVYGHIVTYISEYEFSSVYHSPKDSTSYISFDYMTKLTKASLATIYSVMQDVMIPGVLIECPGGLPEHIVVGDTAVVEVLIEALGFGEIVPGSQMLHYSINGEPYATEPMVEVSPRIFRGEFPRIRCDDVVEYYFSADEVETGTYYFPDPSEPHMPIAASQFVTLFSDDFETDQGWIVQGSATSGHWERCIPIIWGFPASPMTDFDDLGVFCYVTGNYNSSDDVDNGETILTSPTIDMSIGDSQIRYARWFYNRWGSYDPHDSMSVYISSNGGMNWILIETVGPDEEASGGWIYHSFAASEFVTPTGHIRLKFITSDIGTNSPVESGLDAVNVVWNDCYYEEPPLCGDADRSDQVDIDDVVFLINYIFAGGPAPDPLETGDADCSDGVDIDDVVYLINYIFGGGPEPCAECF